MRLLRRWTVQELLPARQSATGRIRNAATSAQHGRRPQRAVGAVGDLRDNVFQVEVDVPHRDAWQPTVSTSWRSEPEERTEEIEDRALAEHEAKAEDDPREVGGVEGEETEETHPDVRVWSW